MLPPSSPFKRFLDRKVPFLYRPLRSAAQQWKDWRFRVRYRRIVETVVAHSGWKVQSGPFAGMHYLTESRSSVLLPKLLGTYEDELHPTLERFFQVPYSSIVDIGCAEGYYAVGLAIRFPSVMVHAFDIDPRARALCTELAAKNNVMDRVIVEERFTPDIMGQLPEGRQLVICDVDGFETQLFTPQTVLDWRRADLLVELHDFMNVPSRESVQKCLSNSHLIEIIPSRAKTPPPLPSIAGLSPTDRALAVNEIRPSQDWLIATRR